MDALNCSTIPNTVHAGHASLKGWSLIFYGTTQPIDANDPISVPVNPPQSTPSKSGQTINYSASIVPKQPGGKGNRKQQQQQQLLQLQKNASANNAPFVIIQPRKNSKIQKNPNGKGPKQQKQTTPHPFTTLYFNKDRKYDFVNGIMSVNRPTTSMSLAAAVAVANNKQPLTNIVDGRIGGDKAIGHEKSAAKAPKQIKEKTATTKASKASTIGALAAQIEMLDAFQQHTANPGIPKFFQKYEKIQQIYPEFHPYVVQQPKQATSNSGKPSRDGSRNQFFSGDSPASGPSAGGSNGNFEQSSAFAGPSQKSTYSQSSAATKKSSAVANNAGQQIRTQNSAFVSSSTKIGKG